MTLLSSTRQNTARNFYITSTTRTHTSNSQLNPHNRTHFHFWTLSSPFNQTTPSALQYTENLPTQINIYTGTATTTLQPNKVSSTPWYIGQRQSLPHRTAWTRNWTTSRQPSNTVNSPPGPSTNGTTGSSIHNNSTTPPIAPTTTTQLTKPKPRPPWLFHTSPKYMNNSRKCVKRKGVHVLEVLKYSLEQYICFVVRQAFIHYCGLHQV